MIRESQIGESPYPPSGVWPATTSLLGIDHRASDPDSWTQLPSAEPEWAESFVSTPPAVIDRRGWEPMNGQRIGDAILVVLLLTALATLVAAWMHLAG